MSWQDQGRQEHGCFGSGTAPEKPADNTSRPGHMFGPGGLVQRIQAVAHGALAALPAIAFAELWPAVLSDLEKMTLTLNDLRRVRLAGTSLYALSAEAG